MKRLPQKQLQRVVLITGLLAWMGSEMMVLVHQIVVQHARCAEHGELIEMDAGAHELAGDRPTITAEDPDDDHDHDCIIDGVALELIASKPHQAALKIPIIVSDPLLRAGGGARAPPLTYAPKTSPPTC